MRTPYTGFGGDCTKAGGKVDFPDLACLINENMSRTIESKSCLISNFHDESVSPT